MSNNDYILNLLNIKDSNINIFNNIEERVIKNRNYKIIEGVLTYIPEYCPCCGIVNESHNDIIKCQLNHCNFYNVRRRTLNGHVARNPFAERTHIEVG